MDTSDEWIQERTGIRERRWVLENSDESTSSMGTEAAKKAIDNAGISPDQIDFIIFATLSGEVTPYRRSVFEERIRETQKEMKLKDSKN